VKRVLPGIRSWNRESQIFSETKNLKGNESCSYILEKLWNFSEGKTVEDDITLLIIDAD